MKYIDTLARLSPGARRFVPALIVLGMLGGASTASAADIVTARAVNVTPDSTSVAWTFDEPVMAATIRVYLDAAASNEITGQLNIQVLSADVSFAHDFGVVMVQASGLDADTDYFFQLETVSASGVNVFPATGAGVGAHTAVAHEIESQLNPGFAFANDILRHPVVSPGGLAPADGILTLLEVPASGQFPIASFGRQQDSDEVALTLGNIFDAAGRSYEVLDDTALKITQWRGLLCAPAQQADVAFRRARTHQEVPRVVAADFGNACFAADTLCDDVIDVLDFQFVLNATNTQSGDCPYSQHLDTNQDGVIDAQDRQQVIDRLGDVAPF